MSKRKPSRNEWPPYRISEPKQGWRNHGSFDGSEKAKLRPIAETLAMLDGNAFFTMTARENAEWYEQYLPEASALYESNGGDDGWASEASFAKPFVERLKGSGRTLADATKKDSP